MRIFGVENIPGEISYTQCKKLYKGLLSTVF